MIHNFLYNAYIIYISLINWFISYNYKIFFFLGFYIRLFINLILPYLKLYNKARLKFFYIKSLSNIFFCKFFSIYIFNITNGFLSKSLLYRLYIGKLNGYKASNLLSSSNFKTLSQLLNFNINKNFSFSNKFYFKFIILKKVNFLNKANKKFKANKNLFSLLFFNLFIYLLIKLLVK